MRILQIITLSELGGAQTIVINLANKLFENQDDSNTPVNTGAKDYCHKGWILT